MSSRQADVNKNKILDWLKNYFVHKELDVSQISNTLWSIQIGGGPIAIYSMTNTPERVIVQSDVNFTEDQQDLLNKKWDKPKLSKLQLMIASSLTNTNLDIRVE